MRMTKNKKRRTGAILVTAVFASLLLLIVVSILAAIALGQSLGVTAYSQSMKAFYFAESGRYIAKEVLYQLSLVKEEPYTDPIYFWSPAAWSQEMQRAGWRVNISGNNITGAGNEGAFSIDAGGYDIEKRDDEWEVLVGEDTEGAINIIDSSGYFPGTGDIDESIRRRVRDHFVHNTDFLIDRPICGDPVTGPMGFASATAGSFRPDHPPEAAIDDIMQYSGNIGIVPYTPTPDDTSWVPSTDIFTQYDTFRAVRSGKGLVQKLYIFIDPAFQWWFAFVHGSIIMKCGASLREYVLADEIGMPSLFLGKNPIVIDLYPQPPGGFGPPPGGGEPAGYYVVNYGFHVKEIDFIYFISNNIEREATLSIAEIMLSNESYPIFFADGALAGDWHEV